MMTPNNTEHEDAELERNGRRRITIRPLPDGPEKTLRLPASDTLLEVLQKGAHELGIELLPNSTAPFDTLHNIKRREEVGPAIVDLDQQLGEYLKEKHTTHDFGIDFKLAFRVNTRWAVAPKSMMTPREILALPQINLDYQQYTLYRRGSSEPLPLDTALEVKRGDWFEAQKDGKYGGEGGFGPPHFVAEAQKLNEVGVSVAFTSLNGQSFAKVGPFKIPSPPWEKTDARILIALPLDASADLDAFYLELPNRWNQKDHPRAQGNVIELDGASWKLVSWHYADGKPWRAGVDNLETHIEFCRGFFLHRGATNGY